MTLRNNRRNKWWTQEEWEAFVEIWQTSETVQEVADRTGLSKQHVQNQAANIRKQDVPLKRMNPPKKILNYDKLAALANKLA